MAMILSSAARRRAAGCSPPHRRTFDKSIAFPSHLHLHLQLQYEQPLAPQSTQSRSQSKSKSKHGHRWLGHRLHRDDAERRFRRGDDEVPREVSHGGGHGCIRRLWDVVGSSGFRPHHQRCGPIMSGMPEVAAAETGSSSSASPRCRSFHSSSFHFFGLGRSSSVVGVGDCFVEDACDDGGSDWDRHAVVDNRATKSVGGGDGGDGMTKTKLKTDGMMNRRRRKMDETPRVMIPPSPRPRPRPIHLPVHLGHDPRRTEAWMRDVVIPAHRLSGRGGGQRRRRRSWRRGTGRDLGIHSPLGGCAFAPPPKSNERDDGWDDSVGVIEGGGFYSSPPHSPMSSSSSHGLPSLLEGYHAVVSSWTGSGSGRGGGGAGDRNSLLRAETWLEEMERELVLPILEERSSRATTAAEGRGDMRLKKLLIQEELRDGIIFGVGADERATTTVRFVDVYRLILSAWGRSHLRDAPRRAERWMDRLLDLCRRNLSLLEEEDDASSSLCYGDRDGGGGGGGGDTDDDDEFRRLHRLRRRRRGELMLLPDDECFAHVISAHANSNVADATEMAERWLERCVEFKREVAERDRRRMGGVHLDQLDDRRDSDEDVNSVDHCRPSEAVYREVIRCWSRSGHELAGEMAEEWMRRYSMDDVDDHRVVGRGGHRRRISTARPPLPPLDFEYDVGTFVSDMPPFALFGAARGGQNHSDYPVRSHQTGASHADQSTGLPRNSINSRRRLPPSIETYCRVVDAYVHTQRTHHRLDPERPVAVSQVDLALSSERLFMEMMRIHFGPESCHGGGGDAGARSGAVTDTSRGGSSLPNDEPYDARRIRLALLSVVDALSEAGMVDGAESLIDRMEGMCDDLSERRRADGGRTEEEIAAEKVGVRHFDLGESIRPPLEAYLVTMRRRKRALARPDVRPDERSRALRRVGKLLDRVRTRERFGRDDRRRALLEYLEVHAEAGRGSGQPPHEVLRCLREEDFGPSGPSVLEYNALINAWRLSRCQGSPLEVEALIRMMEEEDGVHRRDGVAAYTRPNLQTYVYAVLAWATACNDENNDGSSSFGATAHRNAEMWLNRGALLLVDGAREGGVRGGNGGEGEVMLAYVIRSCLSAQQGRILASSSTTSARTRASSCSDDDDDCEDPADVALRAYETMRDVSVRPDHHGYAALARCVGLSTESFPPGSERRNAVLARIFDDCREAGKVHGVLVSELEHFMDGDAFRRLIPDPVRLRDDSWSRNVYPT